MKKPKVCIVCGAIIVDRANKYCRKCYPYGLKAQISTKCYICGKSFITNNLQQKYCDNDCRKKAYKNGYDVVHPTLSKGTVGAISELVVAIYLLKKGYEVYRAVSQSYSGDLYVTKEKFASKIEVRTGNIYKKTGSRRFAKNNIRAPILVVYFPENDSFEFFSYPSFTNIEM